VPQEPEELPLFPLNVVLFPGMALPLRIFEQRYRLMISRCLEEQRPFGIVLIKKGREVGEPAVPFPVGTSARIEQVERLQDGRMNILTRGEGRFRVLEVVQNHPYLVGRVEEFPEPEENRGEELVEQVQQAYSEYVRTLIGLRGGWVRDVSTPKDPVSLSYFVAHTLRIELPNKQRLLETPNAHERLERELFILTEARERLRRELERKHIPEGPRLN